MSFDSTQVTHTAVGTATVTFTDGANGTFTYTLNGVSQTKTLTRFVFRAPGGCVNRRAPRPSSGLDQPRARQWQSAHTLPAQLGDGIGHGRCQRRHAWLANAGWLFGARHDVHFDFGHLVDA